MKTISPIILSLNKRDYTRACLESLLPTSGVQLDVVVVDNGSTDGSLELLAEMKPEFERRGGTLRWVDNGRNVGCCVARNQGLELAVGEYCVFMDNDIMAVEPDWARRLLDALVAEDAAIVGPKMIYPFAPHDIQCAGVGISRTGRVQFRGRGRRRGDPEFNERRDCQCLISACYLFPRALYEEIGGLDEAFTPIEFEDFDWCYRAREAGHRVIYEPSVEMFHWESITSEGTERLPNTYLIIRNGILFKKRWRHMFAEEDGPADEDCRWERIAAASLDDAKRTR
jgi:GT2 family glycosyltransferase